uniref:Tail protein n=1 Tax=viral metagenome TaxID=1070528 RepID=A0A6M3JX75_9ZZZZ
MAWSAPKTWTAGEVVTASDMNTYIRDNQRYLKGIGQVPTIESGLTIDNTDGDERLLLPLLSTAECSTVLNAEGEVAFDETTHQMKEYDGTAVRALISEADVDDTPVNGATTVPVSSNWAYDHLALLTTAGDIIYATAAGTWARLAIGTNNQFLRVNTGATAPEWETFTPGAASGNYAGNDGTNTAIAHGLGSTPKFVHIMTRVDQDTWSEANQMTGYDYINTISYNADAFNNDSIAVTAMDATNFYVGHATEHGQAMNATGLTYYWIAIG